MRTTSLLAATSIALLLSGCAAKDHECTCGSPAKSAAAETPKAPVMIAGIPEGFELVPQASYSASQVNGAVIIRASGKAPTAGYEVKLEQSMLRIYPPQYLLIWKKPTGMVAQVETPFDVTATFKAAEPVASVIISDAAGKHETKVDQARE